MFLKKPKNLGFFKTTSTALHSAVQFSLVHCSLLNNNNNNNLIYIAPACRMTSEALTMLCYVTGFTYPVNDGLSVLQLILYTIIEV